MSLIDDIKRDRESGTPGSFSVFKEFTVGFPVIGFTARVRSKRDFVDADTRRIARVPEMEAALLKADELADAVSLERSARTHWEDTPTDRGGSHGPKGKARAAWQLRRAELHVALAAYRKTTGTNE